MTAAAADDLFDREGWWDPKCREFASLRQVSAFRLDILASWLGDDLRDQVVVDLGCGGGLLAIPLADRGSKVVGIDLAALALRAAAERRSPRFQAIRAEMHACPVHDARADIVLLADVLEHVTNPAAAVLEAARILRPGGHLFVNTISRTLRSRLLAIWLGEGLGFVPRGTHQWRMFIKPSELEDMARDAGLRRTQLIGEAPRLWQTIRGRAISLRESSNTDVGYAAMFTKEVA